MNIQAYTAESLPQFIIPPNYYFWMKFCHQLAGYSETLE